MTRHNNQKGKLIGLIIFLFFILSDAIGSVSISADSNRFICQYNSVPPVKSGHLIPQYDLQGAYRFCGQYAREAIRQFHQAESKGCQDLNSPEWSNNYEYQYGRCRKGTLAMAKRELLERQRKINKCTGTSGFHESSIPELMYKWDLKHVAYKTKQEGFIPIQPTSAAGYKTKQEDFVPQTYGGFRLFSDGTIVWSDGCHKINARYTLFGKIIHIEKPSSFTIIGCRKKIEDVHYEDAIYFSFQGNRLILETPTQIYTLEKHPFSEMSLNPWSLHSITNRTTGEIKTIDRFQAAYRNLSLEIIDDEKFIFHDSDGQIYTGAIEVGQKGQIRMYYTADSEERIHWREKTYDDLSDNKNEDKKTKQTYASYITDELDWKSVNGFKIENKYLLFYTKDDIYKFEPK